MGFWHNHHALEIFHDFNFSGENKRIFTMDITSLYTVIPNNEGLQALRFFFDQRTIKEPSSETLLRLAELVLTLNCCSFADNHYKQVNGVAMGTKMSWSSVVFFDKWANLYMLGAKCVKFATGLHVLANSCKGTWVIHYQHTNLAFSLLSRFPKILCSEWFPHTNQEYYCYRLSPFWHLLKIVILFCYFPASSSVPFFISPHDNGIREGSPFIYPPELVDAVRQLYPEDTNFHTFQTGNSKFWLEIRILREKILKKSYVWS